MNAQGGRGRGGRPKRKGTARDLASQFAPGLLARMEGGEK